METAELGTGSRQVQQPRQPGDDGFSMRPVFRSSTFEAEERRARAGTTRARILFVDEGNLCRSVLAEACLRGLLLNSPTVEHVEVASASVGPTVPGRHDSRVAFIAKHARILLPARRARVFDETRDIVNFDLVLVMDGFDYDEVLREVAVFDKIYPGGYYSVRIRKLGAFSAACPADAPLDPRFQGKLDIPDPMYGNTDDLREFMALKATTEHIQEACRGLRGYLELLHTRCTAGISLGEALAQSLRCPLMGSDLLPSPARSAGPAAFGGHRPPGPLWVGPGPGGEQVFSVRRYRGRQQVIRKQMRPQAKWGYWTKFENVETELLAWIEQRGLDGRMPTQGELRAGGASPLARAITLHGGTAVIAKRLRLDASRRPNGYWDHFPRVQAELLQLVAQAGGAPGVMPTQQQLLEAGRSDLAKAIQQWGGFGKVARSLGLSSKARPRSLSLAEVEAELRAVCAGEGLAEGCMPSPAALKARGRHQLVGDIERLGGFAWVAEQLQLKYAAKRLGPRAFLAAQQALHSNPVQAARFAAGRLRLPDLARASDVAWWFPLRQEVAHALLELLRDEGLDRTRMPPRQLLADLGHQELMIAIDRCGGFKRMAQHLGLQFTETRGRKRSVAILE